MAASDRFSLIFETISNYCGSWRNLFAGIGLLGVGVVTVRSIYAILRDLSGHFLGARNVRYRLTQYGQWAVITGCTRGIGKEFALLLAGYGLDIILVARDESKMNELAQHLETEYGVQTICVNADFSRGAVIYDSIKEALADKEIGILINNVGVMYDYPDEFFNVTEKKGWELVNVNMGSAQAMSHAVLNSCMIRRRKGLIVFVSSLSSQGPSPLMAGYAATKAYESYLAHSLYYECQPYNVHVQTLTPSFVATDMTAYHPLIGEANIFSPSAKDYVRHASWTFGRVQSTTGYFPHTVFLWGAKILPERCWIVAMQRMLEYFRRNALAAKIEQQKIE